MDKHRRKTGIHSRLAYRYLKGPEYGCLVCLRYLCLHATGPRQLSGMHCKVVQVVLLQYDSGVPEKPHIENRVIKINVSMEESMLGCRMFQDSHQRCYFSCRIFKEKVFSMGLFLYLQSENIGGCMLNCLIEYIINGSIEIIPSFSMTSRNETDRLCTEETMMSDYCRRLHGHRFFCSPYYLNPRLLFSACQFPK